MRVDGTKLAFVSCHLTAHEGVSKCEERNASIVEILGGVRAGDKDIDITEQFHHVFWMGDMNYRITFDPAQPTTTKKNTEEFRRQISAQSINMNTVSTDRASAVSPDQVKVTVGGGRGRGGGGGGKSGGKSSAPPIKSSASTNGNKNSKGTPASATTTTTTPTPDVGEEESDDDNDPDANSKAAERATNMKRIFEMIAHEQWHDLLNYDELNREIHAGRVLNDFRACRPQFPPTFKRVRDIAIPLLNIQIPNQVYRWGFKRSDSNRMEGHGVMANITTFAGVSEERNVADFYHEKRYPSYTDRILYKSMGTYAGNIREEFFYSCEEALSSDHKPVIAGFEVALTLGADDIYVNTNLIGRGQQRQKTHILTLKMSNLKGHNLEEMDAQIFGGGSDPYFVIRTDPPTLLLKKSELAVDGSSVKSKVIKHNLNPIWTETLTLELASVDLEGLARNASLIVQVWDEDLANPHDLIGVTVFSMRDILTAILENKSHSFEFNNTVIRSNSEIMGSISGKISFDRDVNEYERVFYEASIGRSGTIPTSQQTTQFISLENAIVQQRELPYSGCACNCTLC
jgi:hypothetical protein